MRTAGGEENFALTGSRTQTFENGSMRFFDGMTLTVTEQSDRDNFIVTGREARVDDPSPNHRQGDVLLTVSDGLVARTGTARLCARTEPCGDAGRLGANDLQSIWAGGVRPQPGI